MPAAPSVSLLTLLCSSRIAPEDAWEKGLGTNMLELLLT